MQLISESPALELAAVEKQNKLVEEGLMANSWCSPQGIYIDGFFCAALWNWLPQPHAVAMWFPSFTLLSTNIPSQDFPGGDRHTVLWSRHSLSCSRDVGGMIRLGCKLVKGEVWLQCGWLADFTALLCHGDSLLRGTYSSPGNAQLFAAPMTNSFLSSSLPSLFSRETDTPPFRKASYV